MAKKTAKPQVAKVAKPKTVGEQNALENERMELQFQLGAMRQHHSEADQAKLQARLDAVQEALR